MWLIMTKFFWFTFVARKLTGVTIKPVRKTTVMDNTINKLKDKHCLLDIVQEVQKGSGLS